MEYERFLKIIDEMVVDGSIYVVCHECRANITKNYLNPFNAGSTKCDHCNKFQSNEKILYVKTKDN